MKAKTELEQDIIDITNIIQQNFPEESAYMSEIMLKFSKSDNLSNKNLEEYYQSLEALFENFSKKNKAKMVSETNEETKFPGYPLYPASDDIYNKADKQGDINPEDTSIDKTLNEEDGLMNELDFRHDMSGDDLDVPGSELDDLQESVGSGDEENNYYSLGGDAHNDLEEDQA